MIQQIALDKWDIAIVVAYIIVLLYIGIKSSTSKEAPGDLFLAGKKLKWPKIGLSLFSTNVSPMMLIGFTSLAYTHGIVGANFEWLAWIYLMILAMIFIPHYQKSGVHTMPRFLKLRYGQRAYRFLSYYSLLSIVVIWLGCSLYAGGLIISQSLGFSLTLAVIGIAFIAVSYTMLGGLNAVVNTDLFQSILILVGSIILTIMAYVKVGGIERLYHEIPGEMLKLFKPASDPEYPWHAILFGYAVVAIFFWCTDQTIVQKVLAARSVEEGQKGALFTSFLKILMPVIFIFPGIFAIILFPGVGNPDEVYLKMVTSILPVGLIGLMVAVMLAALINTIAAGLNSFSTVFTLDVYQRIYKSSEKDTIKIGRLVTLIGAVIAILLATLLSMAGKDLFTISQGLLNFFAPPLTVVFLVGVLWKRATPLAAEVTLIGGGILCILVGMAFYADIPHKDFWPNFLILSVYLFIFLLLVMVIVSLVSKPVPELSLATLKDTNKALGHKSKSIWRYWLALAIIMIALYLFFN